MSEYYLTKDELYHHGIKGQKWGIRRYQNEDGTLTAAGKERYTFSDKDKARYQQLKSKRIKNQFQATEQIRLHNKQQRLKNLSKEDMQKEIKEHDAQVAKNKEKLKKAAIIGVAVAGTALAAYGAYKYVQATKNKAYKLSKEKGEDAIRDIVDVAHTRLMYEDHTDTRVRNTLLKELKNDLSSENEHNAKYNSRSFKAARKTLKGNRRISNAELERSGLRTMNPYRSLAAEDALQSYRTARALNNYETAKLREQQKRLTESVNKYGSTSKAVPFTRSNKKR